MERALGEEESVAIFGAGPGKVDAGGSAAVGLFQKRTKLVEGLEVFLRGHEGILTGAASRRVGHFSLVVARAGAGYVAHADGD